METGISSVLFLFERLKCHNNRAGGPNWVLSYDPYGPARYFIRKRKKKFVLGPEKRVVKLETRIPRKIDAI